jgi:hypothetical protein
LWGVLFSRKERAVPRLKEEFMKITIGLALASGLCLMVAGCAGGGGAAAPGGAAGGAAGGPVASVGGEIRNFNLEVKCPGVHYFKTHGVSDAEIMEKLQIDQEGIKACDAWQAAQPKGYVPPPPPGVTPGKTAASAPSPSAPTPQ